MKKFALFVFTIFFASTTAALAIKNASFSVKCEGQATHCEILGDQSSITTIENCNTPRSWKPPAGHAYLIPRNLLSQCGEKTQINGDRKLVYINDDIIANSYHLLMSCANETSYNTTFYGGTESQWAHELKGSSALSIPYKKKLCLSTGGTFNDSSQT